MLDSSQRLKIQIVIQVWYCSQGNRSKTALCACSSSGLENVSSPRLVFLLSSDDPGPWDPRDPVAVEPLHCPSMFQDLAESKLLEPGAAFVTGCSTSHCRCQHIDGFNNLSLYPLRNLDHLNFLWPYCRNDLFQKDLVAHGCNKLF